MSIFKGHFAASVQENHQFFCDDKLEENKTNLGEPNVTVKILKQLVLTSFNRSSCSTILNASLKYLNNSDIRASRLGANETILDNSNGYYTKFDKSLKKYEEIQTSIDWGTITSLITYHEETQFDSQIPKNEAFEKLLIDINTSLEQGIIIKKELFDGPEVVFKLTFFNRSTRSNEREVGLSNQTTFVGVPSTPYGVKTSYAATNNMQSASPQNIGTIIPADERNKFNQSSVAAPVRMHFDPSSNMYEAGTTQMLARLITKVEPAEVQDLPQYIIDKETPANPQEVVDACTAFTTGEAIPLSLQNGNPNTLGPDYIECGDKKLATIQVVNRSKEEYEVGAVVVVSRINNEWVILKAFVSAPTEEAPAAVGEWTFSKLIANSDHYFKHASFASEGSPATSITPNVYQGRARNIFYNNVKRVLAGRYQNIYNPSEINGITSANTSQITSDFIPTKGYIISSVFDQLPASLGGFAGDDLFVLYNNNSTFLETSDGTQDVSVTPSFFWGPLFPQGYVSVVVDSGVDVSSTNSEFFTIPSLEGVGEDDEEVDSLTTLLQRFLNFDRPEDNLLQCIPAEMTANTLNPIYLFNNWNNMGSLNFDLAQATKTMKPPYHKSTGKFNSVQFTPVSLEFVGSEYMAVDKEGSLGILGSVSLRQAASSIINNMSQIEDGDAPSIVGNMFRRSSLYEGATTDDALKLLCSVNRKNPSPPFAAKGSPSVFMPNLSNYKCDSVTHDGSNIIGMVAAKTTVSKRGNNINFSVSQNFGSLVNRQVSGGQGPTVTILPIGGGIGWSTPGVDPSVRSYPTWGSSQDDISSFGTLALHTRIFDAWPEQQTIFDPRYFSVLHFNPGRIGVPPTSGTPVDGNSPVDFTIPTSVDGFALSSDTPITDTSQLSNTPIKNTIRRGQLLSGNGFSYLRHFVGLNNFNIKSPGTGFEPNKEITIAKGAVIVTSSAGGLTGFSFKQINTETAKYTARGTGVMPSDFSTDEGGSKVFRVSIPSTTPGGSGAIVDFTDGIVYTHLLTDLPPKEYTAGPTRLTGSSNRGNGNDVGRMGPRGFVVGVQESTVTVERNQTNTYDCFFHFHSDAGVYYLNEVYAPVQSIILNVT
jgi:hypothetical protein